MKIRRPASALLFIYVTDTYSGATMAHEHRDFTRSLQIALVITTIFLVVELVGGLISGSLALVSDAGHMFSDALSLLLSLGAITLATFLSVIFTVFAYPSVISHLFKLDSKIVRDRCRFSWTLVAVCLLGSLSHVLIDSLHHEYNPLLFPFTYHSFDALVLMNDWTLASVIIPLSFLALLVLFAVKEVWRGTENIWVRLLVE